jgi:hypothetical protein
MLSLEVLVFNIPDQYLAQELIQEIDDKYIVLNDDRLLDEQSKKT